jgi:hypothetical protein
MAIRSKLLQTMEEPLKAILEAIKLETITHGRLMTQLMSLFFSNFKQHIRVKPYKTKF